MRTKTVIILNGRGGIGKDTTVQCISKYFDCIHLSSITPIKNIAEQNGWDGNKDSKGRKLLSDLKNAFDDYCDMTHRHVIEECKKFVNSPYTFAFVDVREPEKIDRLKKDIDFVDCVTMLITKPDDNTQWGNPSDDNVDNYNYDHIFVNDANDIQELEHKIIIWLSKNILQCM